MLFNGAEKHYDVQPVEQAWRKRLSLVEGMAARSGAVRARIMTNAEAAAYDVPLAVVRSARSRKAAQTRKARAKREHSPERQTQAETIERLAETGEQVTA